MGSRPAAGSARPATRAITARPVRYGCRFIAASPAPNCKRTDAAAPLASPLKSVKDQEVSPPGLTRSRNHQRGWGKDRGNALSRETGWLGGACQPVRAQASPVSTPPGPYTLGVERPVRRRAVLRASSYAYREPRGNQGHRPPAPPTAGASLYR